MEKWRECTLGGLLLLVVGALMSKSAEPSTAAMGRAGATVGLVLLAGGLVWWWVRAQRAARRGTD